MRMFQVDWLQERLALLYSRKYDTQKWLTVFLLSLKGFSQKTSTALHITSYAGSVVSGLMLLANNTWLRRKDILTSDEEKQSAGCNQIVFAGLQKGLTLLENASLLGTMAEMTRRLINGIDFDETDQTYQLSSLIIAGIFTLRAGLGIYEIANKKALAGSQKLVLLCGPSLTLAEAATILSRLFLNLNYDTSNTINIGLAALNTIISRIMSCRLIAQVAREVEREEAARSIADLSRGSIIPVTLHGDNNDSDSDDDEENYQILPGLRVDSNTRISKLPPQFSLAALAAQGQLIVFTNNNGQSASNSSSNPNRSLNH